MTSCPLDIYSDILSLTFPIPVYDYFHKTRCDHPNIKLYLISSYLERNTILFGILVGSPTNDSYHYPEILTYLKKLEHQQEITRHHPEWSNSKKYFIRAVLCNDKILTRYSYINNISPIGQIMLPPLIDIEKLAVGIDKSDTPLKLVSHYVLHGDRGFFVFNKGKVHVLNHLGAIELEDSSNIADEVYQEERLYLNWGHQIMRDHLLTEPFVIGFIYTHRQFVVDLIGVKHQEKVTWQIPVFSVGCFHLNIVDIRKCPIYTVYLNGSTSYRQQIQTVIFDTLRTCPVKPFLNAPMNITADLYWTNEKELTINQFYFLRNTYKKETST